MKVIEVSLEIEEGYDAERALAALRIFLDRTGWKSVTELYDPAAECQCGHPRDEHLRFDGELWCFGFDEEGCKCEAFDAA